MKPKRIGIQDRRRIMLAALGVFVGVCRLNAEMGPTPDARLINALDRVIQSRFQEIDGKDFGIRRLSPQHVGKFEAKTATERDAIAKLESAGWEARLYVPSRSLLSKESQGSVGRDVVIVGDENRDRLPREATLWEEAKKTFTVFETKSKSEQAFKVDQWHIAARPIRASKPACLACHNRSGETLKVGDTLGVALYAFLKKL